MTAIPKPHKPIDDDAATQLLVERYRQLDGYKRTIDEEMSEIRQKLLVRADELQVEQLTVGGRPVVSVSHYLRYSVNATQVLKDFPTVYELCGGSASEVVRVSVR